MNYEKMSDRELDVEICRKVMQWRHWEYLEGDYDGQYPCFADWGEGSKGMAVYEDEESGDATRYFSPSTSLDHAAEMEARIVALVLQHKYILALIDLTTDDVSRVNASLWDATTLDWFALATASPR